MIHRLLKNYNKINPTSNLYQLKESFGILKKEKRVFLKLKQREIASLMGISQSKYCKIESGKSLNNIAELLAVSKYLNIKLQELEELLLEDTGDQFF